MKNLIRKTCLHSILYSGLLLAMQGIYSCKTNEVKEISPPDVSGKSSMSANTINTWSPWVAISNTTDKTLEIYNYTSTTWNPTTRNWVFKPTIELGYSSGAVTALGAGMGDFRVHGTNGFAEKATSAIVVQGGRWLGIGAYQPSGGYAKGQKLWEYTFPSSQDPNNHAVELLPNGNIAVAGFGNGSATSPYGNWVRIYNTADSTGASYAQANIIAPHALLYDTIYHRLWVGAEILIGGLAYHGIFAYIIGGTRTSPTITEDVSLRAVLRYGNPSSPTGVPDHLKFPHDLAADFDNDNILYYGDHTGVYIFNKVTKTYTSTPGASHRYSGTDVTLKSIGKQQGGYYISTVAENPSYPYYSNKVDFFDPVSGNLAFSRTVSNYTIYRARVWTHPYH